MVKRGAMKLLVCSLLVILLFTSITQTYAYYASGSGDASGTFSGRVHSQNEPTRNLTDVSNIINKHRQNLRERLKNYVEEPQYFVDVSLDDYCYTAVQALASAGLIYGTGDGKFSPDALISNREWVLMVTRGIYPEILTSYNPTTDLDNILTALVIENIINGIDPAELDGGFTARTAYDRTFQALGIRVYGRDLYDDNYTGPCGNAYEVAQYYDLVPNNLFSGGFLTRGEAAYIFYTVCIADIDIPEPDYLSNLQIDYSGYYEVDRVLRTLQGIPSEIIHQFIEDGWSLYVDNPYLDYYNIANNKNAIGLTSPSQKEIYVSDSNALKHEFGHYLWSKLPSLYQASINNLFITEIEGLTSLTGVYCRTNTKEYFSEAFEYYLRCLDRSSDIWLNEYSRLAPETYKLLKTLDDNGWILDQ